MIKIYPEFRVTTHIYDKDTWEYFTYVRKEYLGIYYLIPVRYISRGKDKSFLEFTREVYKTLILYDLSTADRIVDNIGTPIVVKDQIQIPEKERLFKKYIPNHESEKPEGEAVDKATS